MSQSSTSLLFKAGLLVATMLTNIPTKLHAETNPPNTPSLQPQTSTTPQPLTTIPTSLVPAVTGTSQQEPLPPKLEMPPLTGTSIPTPAVITPIAKQPLVTPAVVTPTAKQPIATPTVVTPAAKQPATPAVATPTAKQPLVTPTVVTPAVQSAITASTSQPPVIEVVNLVLKLNEKKVYVYKGDKLITKYPVAIGKKGWETPTGEWQVMEKVTNPGWTSFKDGKVIKPGSQSPLGQRWIGFWTDGKDMIGFHGTPDVKSIGTAASHGCVRMLNKDVKALFPLVKVGTTVKVVSE